MQFAPHLAHWVRREPCKTLGAQYNIPGLLARIVLTGAVKPEKVPRQEKIEASGRVTYTKHFIGRTWNGDGLEEIITPRLKLGDFKRPKYTRKNASWFALKHGRARTHSASFKAVLNEVGHDGWQGEGQEDGDGGGGGGGGGSAKKGKRGKKGGGGGGGGNTSASSREDAAPAPRAFMPTSMPLAGDEEESKSDRSRKKGGGAAGGRAGGDDLESLFGRPIGSYVASNGGNRRA